MFRRLIRHPAFQVAAARVLGVYLALVFRTSRWRLEAAPDAVAWVQEGRPLILAFWHERLPIMPVLMRLALPLLPPGMPVRPHVLVSRHRDGRFIGEVVRRFGLRMVYGSSNRGGGQALLELVRALGRGDLVAITPDGPRGPRRVAAPGVAQLAAMSGLPVVPAGAATTARHLLPSWDRMMLPLPFGRGVLVCGAPIHVPREGAEEALPGIAAALTEACERADALLARRA
jgi:hypothetical protein